MNNKYKSLPRIGWLISSLVLFALVATPVIGQTEDEEDVFELSPFEVSATDAIGYEAQNTLAGTRLRSSVKDVGATMTIVTEQFLEDLALTSINDLIEFTPGAEKDTTQEGSGVGASRSLYWGDNTRFRGKHAESIYRNQFKTNLPSDSYNAGRYEITRGANAILFGIGDPGGSVNRYTNDALWWDLNRWRVQFSNHGQVRNEFKFNKVLKANKLAVTVAALVDQDEIWIEPNFQDQKRIYGAMTWRPNDKLTIKVRGESMDWDRSAVEYAITQDAITPFLDAAAAAGESPEAHAIPWNQWTWNSPGTYPAEFREWNLTGTFPGTTYLNFDGMGLGNNWMTMMNYPVGADKNVLGNSTISLSPDYIPNDWQPSGHSQIQHFAGYNYQGVVQYKVNDHFNLEYGYNKEFMAYDFYANWGTTTLRIDAASTLRDMTTPNPNVGKYFVHNNTNWQMAQERDLTNHRLTASFEWDFDKETPKMGWLGHHSIAVLLEQEEDIQLWDSMRLMNTTPLYALDTSDDFPDGILWSGWGTPNSINYINYVDPATKTIFGPSDPRDIAAYASTIDGINAEWIPTYTNPAQARAFSNKTWSTLFVLQSKFWEDRIVTTFGWREDNTKDYDSVVGQNPNALGGVAMWAADVERELQIKESPDTLSRGVVFHAYESEGFLSGLSFYYNYATSFGESSLNNTPMGELSPNKTGETTDYGVKFGLMDNKINGVFTIFESTVLNQPILDNINYGHLGSLMEFIGMPEFLNISHVRDRNDLASEGWELQLSANPAKNWRIMASIDHYKTTKSNIAPVTGEMIDMYRDQWLVDPNATIGTSEGSRSVQDIFDELWFSYQRAKSQEGSRTMNERRYKVTFVSSYDFDDGPLKGWGFGGNLIWKDKASTGYALKFLDDGSWVLDPDNPFESGDLLHVGAHIRYKTKLWDDKIAATFQLNIRNIGGVSPYVVRHAADVSAPNVPVPQVINRGEPTTYVFSAMFDF